MVVCHVGFGVDLQIFAGQTGLQDLHACGSVSTLTALPGSCLTLDGCLLYLCIIRRHAVALLVALLGDYCTARLLYRLVRTFNVYLLNRARVRVHPFIILSLDDIRRVYHDVTGLTRDLGP